MRQPLLALLAEGALAMGDELKLALEQTFGQAYPSPNIGQIYVTLKRLEQDGLVQRGRGADHPAQQARLRAHGRRPTRRCAPGSGAERRTPDSGATVFDQGDPGADGGLADRMELMSSQRRHYLGIMRNLIELQAEIDPAIRSPAPISRRCPCGPRRSPACRTHPALGHLQQLRGPGTGRDIERDERPVPVRAQLREDLVQLIIRDAAGHLPGHLRPVESGIRPVGLHRIVVRVRPPAPPRPAQRERVHDRPGPGLEMEAVKGAEHRLAVRPDRRRIRLPWPLASDDQPAAEIPCLAAGRPVPRTPDADRNRNHRSRSSACTTAPWLPTCPAACRSANHSDTAGTAAPSGPMSRYGSCTLPVSSSDPAAGTASLLLHRSPAGITFNEYYDGDGTILFRHACRFGCEGIVSKRLGSPYRSGRVDDWLKIENPLAPAAKREADRG